MNITDNDTSLGGYIVAGLILLYLVVQFFKALLPFAIGATIISLIIALTLTFADAAEDLAVWVWIAFGIFGLLSLISLGIGYGIEGTETGKALVDAGGGLYQAEQTIWEAEDLVEDTLKNATIEVIDAMQNQTTPETRPVLEVTKALVVIS